MLVSKRWSQILQRREPTASFLRSSTVTQLSWLQKRQENWVERASLFLAMGLRVAFLRFPYLSAWPRLSLPFSPERGCSDVGHEHEG